FCLLLLPSFVYFCLFFSTFPSSTWSHSLSLHDALPISGGCNTPIPARSLESTGSAAGRMSSTSRPAIRWIGSIPMAGLPLCWRRSEEHTSELQSRENLVCRLLLEKKKN